MPTKDIPGRVAELTEATKVALVDPECAQHHQYASQSTVPTKPKIIVVFDKYHFFSTVFLKPQAKLSYIHATLVETVHRFSPFP